MFYSLPSFFFLTIVNKIYLHLLNAAPQFLVLNLPEHKTVYI